MNRYKVCIIGGGVAGIFTAIQLLNEGFNGDDIVIFDKGHSLQKRKCFVNANSQCKKCKVCSIVNGVGGAGSFSDSKLNFDTSGRIGGDLYELMTEEEITEYLSKTYEIYKQFGIDEFKSKAYGNDYTEEALEIVNKIKENPNLELGECTTIHLGTDNSRIIYGRMVNYLIDSNVTILPDMEVKDVNANGNTITVSDRKGNNLNYQYDILVLAMGRSGNKLMRDICEENNISMKNGRVDYGVRVETLDSIMKPLNDNFYESKIYIRGEFNDRVRVFCSNPSGFVSVESYPYLDNQIYLANGHAYADKKSKNTNFALLVSRNFNEDCQDPLNNYLYPLINASSSLGKGSVICQSLKDIKLFRRSTEERINELEIVPTANVYKGDITSVMPYRTLKDILDAIKELDKLCPGLDGDNTLLYSMEAKFHANKIKITKEGKTSIDNIYAIGDCSGYCRGLTTAAGMGIKCAEDILLNLKN